MATTSLVFPTTPTTIDLITLDCLVSEHHQNETEITDHPVEEGADIADHKRPKPAGCTLEGVITNTPLPSTGDSVDPTRVQTYYQQLLDLKNSATLITVVTPLQTYTNATVASVTGVMDQKTGQSMKVTIAIKEVNQVALQVAKVSPAAGGKVSTGKKGTSETAPTQAKSILAQGVDKVFH